jgi:acetyl-CoA carboxylase carboxyl transferase subunit beta
MSWFKRSEKGIHTKTEEKKDIPKGLWYQTPTGKIIEAKELAENKYVSPEDDYHVHIGSKEYFEILFDDNEFVELNEKLKSKDFLKFEDSKKYSNRLKDAFQKTGLHDAIRTAVGPSKSKKLGHRCMDFRFHRRFYGFCSRRENCSCLRTTLSSTNSLWSLFPNQEVHV